ncbi:uncharacterized protein LOC113203641 [Frankliniella occidentalis]|uniref:Uncharacterized protein LOC113203641 n=1 Tax=Frankliniella occidentalis TaxID=133901 RepID=A0A6J1RZI0_FRAOC|nr:uncharacterized protein LOC113203641 [Frankliniella occidentalis]
MESYPLCVFWVAGVVLVAGAPFAGPYIGYVDRFIDFCAEKDYNHIAELEAQITRFNPNKPFALQAITGNFTYTGNRGFDDTYWSRFRLDSRSSDDRGWINNAFVFNFPAKGCSALRDNIPDFARVMIGEAFVNSPSCLVKPGVYIVDNQPVNWSFPNVPIMPYGHWRAHIAYGKIKSPTADFCASFEAHTIPRPKQAHKG